MITAMHVTTRAGLDLTPEIVGGMLSYRVSIPGVEDELGYVLLDAASGRWLIGLPGGFPASTTLFRNDTEAIEALRRAAGLTSTVPPLYARMTYRQLEAEEEAISRNYPALGSQSSRDLADRFLSEIDAQKRLIVASR